MYSAVGSSAHHTVRAGYQGTETGGLCNLGILSSILFLLLIGPARFEWERKGPLSCYSSLLVRLELLRLCLSSWTALREGCSCFLIAGIHRLIWGDQAFVGSPIMATLPPPPPELLSLPAEGLRLPPLSVSLQYTWGGKLLSMEAFRTWSEVWEKASQAWAIFRPGVWC